MEFLFLSHRIPYPPNKGDKIRSHALLAYLAKRGRVHVACFVDDPVDMQYADAVRQLSGGECLFVPLSRMTKCLGAVAGLLTSRPITIAAYDSNAMTNWLGALAKNHPIDRVVVFSAAMAPYVLDNPALDSSRAVFDMVDIDSDKWRQYAAVSGRLSRWLFGREATMLLRFEREAALRFGATTLVSPFEATSFAAMAPESESRIYPLSNGVDLGYFSPGAHANPFPAGEVPIVMTGMMDYRPNVDAAKWFLDEVMPRLKGGLPNARFYVVGAKPPESLRALAGPSLVVTGAVADVRPYIQHAAAIVAPLRMARGVQNKVLEAMAMEKPIVATFEATRALAVTSGVELWVENEAGAFADAVIEAVQGANRVQVARNARNYVERHHNWQQNLGLIDDLLDRLCGPASADAAPYATDKAMASAPLPSNRTVVGAAS
ncbi:MAG TPA: TIGR03087 family PEP-CTERM/XrtA system glycosyltransferase [Micropepsaceae bacterium]|nr:TIGR03087 family PEP-CTERM/XrtA system glycosyltransferase [Micropepsaceae bacterium]